MGNQDALYQISRTLGEIATQQAKQTRALETLNQTIIEYVKQLSNLELTSRQDKSKPLVVRKTYYSWVYANQMQALGALSVGDRKIEEDESHWVWDGSSWERVDFPSIKIMKSDNDHAL